MGKKLTSIVLSAALLVSGARFTFADVIAQLKSEWNPRVQKQAIEFVVEDTSKPNPIQYDFMDENGSIDKDGNAVLTEVKEKQPSKGIENQYKGNNIRTDQTTFFSAVPIKYLKGVAADCLNAYKGNSSIKGDESTLVSFKSPKSADKKDIGYAIIRSERNNTEYEIEFGVGQDGKNFAAFYTRALQDNKPFKDIAVLVNEGQFLYKEISTLMTDINNAYNSYRSSDLTNLTANFN